jgi:biotin transport system substrate-specific component
MKEISKNSAVPANVLRNRSVFVALFAALIAVTCFIAVPAGPLGVPIVLQNMFVLLAGTILGSIQGAAAVGLFMAAGALGLPVFSGGTGGPAAFASPSGGYIVGYFFGSLAAGLILGRPSITEKTGAKQLTKIASASLIGMGIIYFAGTGRLAQIIMQGNSLTLVQAIVPAVTAGVLPYLVGDVIKLIILIPLTAKLRPVAARYINVME